MTIFFGSDWHLGHKNVIEFMNRPFSSLEAMKDSFLYEYLRKVKKGDTVYLLGDITFSNDIIPEFRELPGQKFLIQGNHDPHKFAKDELIWVQTSEYKKIKVDKQKIILCHYPIESWDGMGKQQSIHLHGHTHNNVSHSISLKERRIDVGYDHTKQALSTLDELLALEKREKVNSEWYKLYED